MDKSLQQNKIRGSLIGGAIGDALGYPVEFKSSGSIFSEYGDKGITQFELSPEGKALISDDTQMTLFTAWGMLTAKSQGAAPEYADRIRYSYIQWLHTQQGGGKPKAGDCCLADIPELNSRRAPGITCLSALNDVAAGREASNNSKGCGGVMRTAPVALYGAVWEDDAEGKASAGRIADIREVDKLAAEAAAITHKHPLGWLPSALEAHIIYRLVQSEAASVADFKEYLAEGYDALEAIYPEQKDYISYMKALTDLALSLANDSTSDVDAMERLGGGWVGDEAFAMAVYCTVKYFGDFGKAMTAAVNHSGDSDSTGAIAGNMLGAAVGYEAIPEHFTKDLELHDVILQMADELWRGGSAKQAFRDGSIFVDK